MKKSFFIAIIITIISILWIGSGFIIPSTPKKAEELTSAHPEKEIMKVKVETLQPQDYTKKISSNGRSQASKNVTVRAEAEGQIIAIIAEEGISVKKGDEIVKIDVSEKGQRVREAQELTKQRKIEFEAAKKLIKQGYASDVRLAQTQSAYESAKASFTRAQIDLEKTTVSAPFDGILGKRDVDIGDYVRIGDSITELVDLDPLEVTVFVNETEVVQLQKGNSAHLRFAGGEIREGVVEFIAPAADEKTRTFRVDIVMDNATETLPSGLTAQVDIAVKSKKAYQISPSILTLDDDGVIGVKIVKNDNSVEFVPVTILDDKADKMWISGLEGSPKVITVGQDFVIDGQIVEPSEKEAVQ